jgi:hypothetical protein
LIFIISLDLLLLVQKLKAVGTNKSNNGHHIEIFNDLAMNVNIVEQIIHITANKNI